MKVCHPRRRHLPCPDYQPIHQRAPVKAPRPSARSIPAIPSHHHRSGEWSGAEAARATKTTGISRCTFAGFPVGSHSKLNLAGILESATGVAASGPDWTSAKSRSPPGRVPGPLEGWPACGGPWLQPRRVSPTSNSFNPGSSLSVRRHLLSERDGRELAIVGGDRPLTTRDRPASGPARQGIAHPSSNC